MPSGVPCGSVSHLLVCTRGGVVLHERLFAGQEEADTSRVVSLRAALWTIAQPLLHSAREEEEHVALHECVACECAALCGFRVQEPPPRRVACSHTAVLTHPRAASVCRNLTVLWFAVSDLLVFVTGEGVVVDELSCPCANPLVPPPSRAPSHTQRKHTPRSVHRRAGRTGRAAQRDREAGPEL